MANNERLDSILEFIKSHEGQWNQESYGIVINRSEVADKLDLGEYDLSDYRYVPEVKDAVDANQEICNSAYCFAGHAVIAFTDYRPSIVELLEGWYHLPQAGDDDFGWTHTIHSVARRELDLTEDQAEALFDGYNELATLEALIEAIKADPSIDMDGLHAIQSKLQPNGFEDWDSDTDSDG